MTTPKKTPKTIAQKSAVAFISEVAARPLHQASNEELLALAQKWDAARTELEAASTAAAAAQTALEALPQDASAEDSHAALELLDAAEKRVKAAQATIEALTPIQNTAAPAVTPTAKPAQKAGKPTPTNTPPKEAAGGNGNLAIPAADLPTGHVSSISHQVLVVVAKQDSRWRAGRNFGRTETVLELEGNDALTKAEFDLIRADPFLFSQVRERI
jgi:hypothetical protein